jgi:hypothetical protein
MALYDGIAATVEIDDGELEQVLSFGIVEAQAGGAPPAGPYQGISFVGMPVSWFALAISLLVVL